MAIQIYNTLTRKKEPFETIKPGEVMMYACGPTVYNYIHIGNARTFLMSDIIRRYLLYSGYKVKFVMNITDIDDRIIHTANESGRTFSEVNKVYSDAFIDDVRQAGMHMPDVIPRVTEHLDEIINLVQTLVLKGYAYESEGSVYYDVGKFNGYGKLSGKNTDDLIAGARVDVNETKQNPLDFVLWKASKPGEPTWDSVWGPGRPGWHIECSAMCMKHLGDRIDIHAGGADLVFPHHENEIAQSEGATGHEFSRYWIHFGFLNVNDEKMSKSLGNFWLLRDVLKKFRPEAIRVFFLQKHYASPLNFSEENLRDADNAHRRIETVYQKLLQALSLKESLGGITGSDQIHPEVEVFVQDLDRLEREFHEAMNDDFNTAAAMGKVFEIFNGLSRLLNQKHLSDFAYYVFKRTRELLDKWNEVLGILNISKSEKTSSDIEPIVKLLIDVRNELRKQKNWSLSDKIRNGLSDAGIIIEDSAEGTTWKMR